MKSLETYIPSSIASHLAQLQKINRALYEIVPIEFLGHIQAAGNPENGIIHIYTDSPAWGAKLRFYQSSITTGLTTRTGLNIKSILIAVHPKTRDRKTQPLKRPALSRKSAQLLTALAKNTEDPELKRALSALAKHTSGSK
ncbi:MAG TPA: DciA family protein [Gammaproteobacteria bacterium]|nr:DciA family protein [Gammaproteobacteria bacterium]